MFFTVLIETAGGALDRALHSLYQYLLRIRSYYIETNRDGFPATDLSEDYSMCEDIATIVDTCLLKALANSDPKALSELVNKNDNKCHLKESKRILLQSGKEIELVALYRTKGKHRDALELLTKSKQTKGLINYLKQLGRKEFSLIQEFSSYPLQTSPFEALEIFTQDRGEDQLPSNQCLTHIKAWAPQLVVNFLKHLVKVQGETSPEIHNELILNLLEMIKNLRGDNSAQKRSTAQKETGLLGSTRRDLVQLLEESKYYTPEKMLVKFSSQEGEDSLYSMFSLLYL